VRDITAGEKVKTPLQHCLFKSRHTSFSSQQHYNGMRPLVLHLVTFAHCLTLNGQVSTHSQVDSSSLCHKSVTQTWLPLAFFAQSDSLIISPLPSSEILRGGNIL